MALSDLSRPEAVTAALDEYDELGPDAFLERYGFGRARTYFVLWNGRAYPSKAIAAAAHGHEHGVALRADEFSGGDATVAAKLETLGFHVLRADRDWMYAEGDIALRSDIHAVYGGAVYGGIEPSRSTPNIMVYTDPQQGALSGYDYDGWDTNEPNVFYYTGEGRTGNQTMRAGNKAILNHEEDGRTLRLWEALEEPARAGGKRQRYVGEFHLDQSAPYRMEPAPDADGNARKVIVFRLVRAEHAAAAPTAGRKPAEPTSSLAAGRSTPNPGNADYGGDAEVTAVPPEQNTVLEFEVAPTTGRLARRDEAKLVSQFENWLRQQGHEPQRLRIKIPGERNELVTDTYDATDGLLYEAKAKSDRATVRLAIGQLLDYLRFTPHSSGSLLLPDEPPADVKQLIHSVGFGLTYRKLGSWVSESRSPNSAV